MKKVNKPYIGLDLDSSPENIKEGSYSFALNSVIETHSGDLGSISNERGNDEYLTVLGKDIPTGFLIVGTHYMGGGETVVFLTDNANSLDQIGIIYGDNTYESFIEVDLSFSILHQIDCVSRVRRGCERVLYFTDGKNKVRTFNFDKLSLFKDSNGDWDSFKLNLIKTASPTLKINSVEVLTGYGAVNIGAHSFGIIYLDPNLNETEIINSTDPLKIYKHSYKKPYLEINGSLPLHEGSENNQTDKAIKIELENLDETYPYYKVVIFSSITGDGSLSSVTYSDLISTSESTFVYTGLEGKESVSKEKATTLQTRFESAQHIEQLENILVLGNIKDKEVEYCRLQQYASSIVVNAVVKTINFNDINEKNNPRRGEVNIEGTGYCPGEIYSLGIEYIFEDGSSTPVYHIPGRAETDNSSNMSTDNLSSSTQYLEDADCSDASLGYWGYDNTGNYLKDTAVRHHRVPERNDLSAPLVARGTSNTYVQGDLYNLTIDIEGEYIDFGDYDSLSITVTWDVDGIPGGLSIFTAVPPVLQNSLQKTSYVVGSDVAGLISNVEITMVNLDGDPVVGVVVDENSSPAFKSYTISASTDIKVEIEDTFSGTIIGLEYSGIELPSGDFLGGNEIVGYRIVRQEREEVNSTVLDSAVMLPITKSENEAAFSVLAPESKICEDAFALVIPKYLFLEQEPTSFTEVKKHGKFEADLYKTEFQVQDINDITSADEDTKKKDSDDDGADINSKISVSVLNYLQQNLETISSDIKDIKYLKPLEMTNFIDSVGDSNKLINYSFDNKIAIVTLNHSLTPGIVSELETSPISVSLRKNVLNPYSNFRVAPFYKEHTNVETSSTLQVYNGDVYTSPMKYFTTSVYRNHLKTRDQESGLLRIIGGVTAILGGVAVGIVSVIVANPGGVSAGVALIQAGASITSNGIDARKRRNAYDAALRGNDPPVFMSGTLDRLDFPSEPQDDQVQHYSGILEDIWFESTVNIHHRFNLEGLDTDITAFLPAPGGLDFSVYRDYSTRKLTEEDLDRKDDKKERVNTPLEVTLINKDYLVRHGIQLNFPLSTSYSCCSECNETFPHRLVWSEQAFQEELSDNYGVYKANNYKDIEGYTGEITNLFRVHSNLFVHTEEALWHLPQNLQERVTDEIVSFIGTGSYFNIPPRLILDSANGLSAGCSHKWATLKTPQGIFFISEYLGVVYNFNGEALDPISIKGIYNWGKDNFKLLSAEEYYQSNSKPYPYRNNTLSKIGSGFATTYDSRLERFIITKKDHSLDSLLEETGSTEICTLDGVTYSSSVALDNLIEDKKAIGWEYTGIDDCELQFKRKITTAMPFEELLSITNDTIIIVRYDYTPSYPASSQSVQTGVVESWLEDYKTNVNPDWEGELIVHNCVQAGAASVISEAWLRSLAEATTFSVPLYLYSKNTLSGGEANEGDYDVPYLSSLQNKNLMFISFEAENTYTPASSSVLLTRATSPTFFDSTTPLSIDYLGYHPDSYYDVSTRDIILDKIPRGYVEEFAVFKSLYQTRETAGLITKSLLYQIGVDDAVNTEYQSLEAIKYDMAYIYGFKETNNAGVGIAQTVLTDAEAALLLADAEASGYFTPSVIAGIRTALTTPVSNDGGNVPSDFTTPWTSHEPLIDYGFSFKGDKFTHPTKDSLMTEEEFSADVTAFLEDSEEVVITDKDIDSIEYDSVALVPIDIDIPDNSFTLSYNLKMMSWTSFHSYMPNLYFYSPDKFYSYITETNKVWKHNSSELYNTYYAVQKPFIIEYSSIAEKIKTKIWDYLQFSTKAESKVNNTKREIRYKTFNKALFYNSRQCSGIINLHVKDTGVDPDYLIEQIKDATQDTVTIDRNEKTWSVNEIRDIVVDYETSIFNKNLADLQSGYFIDKVLNTDAINKDKNWNELEAFRDKYLVVRLIFDNFDTINDVNLTLNFSIEDSEESLR